MGEASHPGPPRLARPAESLLVPSSSEEEQPGEAAAPVCATCLEPIRAGATGRHGAAYWPACQHPYHTGCLARMRARLAPPVCALCRQPWLPAWDADLSAACNYLGFNPFADSEAEAAPPPPAASSPWTARGPPTHPITSPTNSWAYVPLLHAATGSLAPAATAAWRAHPASATWWEESRVALSNAAPVPLERLVDALLATPGPHGAQYGATINAAAASFPPGARVHLGWMLRQFQDGDGYWPAPIQEVALQLYLGPHAAAALDRQTNSFRANTASPPRPRPRQCRNSSQARRPPAPSPSQAPPSRAHGGPPLPTLASQAAPPTPAPSTPRPPPSECEAPLSDSSLPAVREPTNPRLPAAAWTWLDNIDLTVELREPVLCMRQPPRFLGPAITKAYLLPLRLIASEHTTPQQRLRAWKLFLLIPRLLLHFPGTRDRAPRAALHRRTDAFHAGAWSALHAAAHSAAALGPGRTRSGAAAGADALADSRRRRACRQVRTGDLSRARATLTSSALAPGDQTTLAALTDPIRRPPALTRPVPDNLRTFQPPAPVRITELDLVESLRTAKRGAAPGLSGATMEHYKLFLEDAESLQLFTHAINQIAQAAAPEPVLTAIAMARLTALQKPGGAGVRGIATGDALRRLTSRTLARTHASTFDQATRPFQFALQTRAGTDALAHVLQAALDARPSATVVSLDGRAAYDTIYRSAIFSRLLDVAPGLVPFVRACYGTTSHYLWWDAAGECHDIYQAEGVEQGDALAPALFALGQHAGLAAAAAGLQPDERLMAFLDDLYIITTPARARAVYDTTTRAVAAHAGIHTNPAKTRVYTRTGGPAPPGIAALGPDVWRGDRPAPEVGFVALGTPIGTDAFVRAHHTERLAAEQVLLAELERLPDLQCAWLLLTFCAAPRGQHILRTTPPALAADYATNHDESTWRTLCRLLNVDPVTARHSAALAFLPARLGGLGLFSASRVAEAAYYAGWADSLPVIAQRDPALAARCVDELVLGAASSGATFRAGAEAAQRLLATGWAACPPWPTFLQPAAAPPHLPDSEPCLWPHGWQHAASLALLTSYREHTLLPSLAAPEQALLRSQAGPHAGAWLTAIPSDPGLTLRPLQMHTALRRRLRLPLPLARHRCGAGSLAPGCGAALDSLGDHALACPRSGALGRRAGIVERAWVRVAREAVGPEGRVIPQQALAATPAAVPSDDQRRLDMVVHGATPHGEALCCDATLVSPLTRQAMPAHQSHRTDGAALDAARRRKELRYPELLGPGPQRLLVLACEVGGRWHRDCEALLRLLVRTRTPRAPPAVRASAASGWRRRWWSLLSVAVQQAVATTALSGEWLLPATAIADDGPRLADIVGLAPATGPSRLPLGRA